ncbi:MAG TPA: hypothetical protein PKO44_04055 [Candidatus Omnitrophota bacterium]|nr:hypothetical protein [Candidatus Omnitrophota bacterium]
MEINPTIKIITKIACLILVIAALFSRTYQPIETEDIWWHLKAGEWINENKTIPIKDPFPVDPSEKLQPFTQMYSQWLGSLTLFKVYQFAGIPGLKLFRFLIYCATIALLFAYGRKKLPFMMLIWLIFLVLPGLESRCLLRPLLFNFVFIQILIIILFSYNRDPKRYKLFFLLPIGVLWSNLHFGSFVYATSLLGISILTSAMSYIRHYKDTLKRGAALVKIKELIIFTLLYWLMFGINPMGFGALVHNWRVFLDPTYIHFKVLDNIIMELQSPGNIFHVKYMWLHVILISNLILLWRIHSERKFYFTLIYAVSCFFFMYAVRGSDFAILLQSYLLIEMFCALNLKDKIKRLKIFPFICSGLLIALILLYVPIIYQNFHLSVYRDHQKRFYFLEKIDWIDPVKTVQFLEQNNISGNVFNDDIVGGYLIWSSYPKLRPINDGRQTNMARFLLHQKIYENPEQEWESADQQYKFAAIILMQRGQKPFALIQFFQKNPSFVLAFYDSSFIVFLRKELLDEKTAIKIDQDKILKTIQLTPDDLAALKKISDQNPPTNFLKRILARQYIKIDVFGEAITLYNLGYRHAAAKKIIEATKAYSKDEPLPILMRILASDLIKEPSTSSELTDVVAEN